MKLDQRPSLDAAARACAAPGSVAVEIGTWTGDFAYALLTQTKVSTLYCVDPYHHFVDDSYPDGMNSLTQTQFDEKFATVKARLAPFGDRVVFLRMKSLEAAQAFAPSSVQFAYIDGNHDCKAVKDDIRAWYPKIAAGGVLCGDDVYSQNLAEHDSDGNVLRVWSRDSAGKPDCWGKYGTYKALVDCAPELGYTYTIDQTQFLIPK